MKTNPLLLSWLLCVLLFLSGTAGPVAAQTPQAPPDSAQLLREALFEEQGMRDLAKAAAGYEKVISAYEAQRDLAATALFRLAEIRRGQNNKEQAATLYQRLLLEFPQQEPLARLSRENLAALGVKEIPGAVSVVPDAEDARIAELTALLKSSPDLVTGSAGDKALNEAAKKGQAKVVKYLFESGSRPTDMALVVAAEGGHLAVCKMILDRGLVINGSHAINTAVSNGHAHVVRILLQKGADPDDALFKAVQSGLGEIIDLLIEAKADPNLPPPAPSPLYYAVRKGNVEMAKKLLALGADPAVRCHDPSIPLAQIDSSHPVVVSPKKETGNDYISAVAPQGWTLLHAAVHSQNIAMIELILPLMKNLEDPGASGQQTALGLAVSSRLVPMDTLLLKAGAKGNVNGNDGRPLLVGAAKSGNEKLVKALLAAGADARQLSPEGRTIISYLSDAGPSALPVMRLLIQAGADPEAGESSYFASAYGSAPVTLAREYRYPKWAGSREIMLSLPESGVAIPLARESDIPGAPPPALEEVLLSVDDSKIGWLDKLPPNWYRPRLFRRDAQGKLQEQGISNWMEGKADALEWGDVVEFVSDRWTNYSPLESVSYKVGFGKEFRDRLRISLVRHVTVIMEGKAWPITLRGGLKVYNPLKPEAPLTDAVSLMKLMGAADLRWYNASVRITRKPEQGGGEISSKITGGAVIPLKEGDTLELIGDPAPLEWNNQSIYIRNGTSLVSVSDVAVLSPGLLFSKLVPDSGTRPATLVQVLAAAFPPLDPVALGMLCKAEKKEKVTELSGNTAADTLVDWTYSSVLPHPDWSKIKIRRIGPNNELVEIPVDLAAAIGSCNDATTPEEARKFDIELRAGDAVLIPVLPNQTEFSWIGWDAKTMRFFRKALSMKVTLADENDGSFRALELEYMPVNYVDTGAGLLGIPLFEPSFTRVSEFTASAFVSAAASGKIARWVQGADSKERNFIHMGAREWLRDKDTIGYSLSIPSPPKNANSSGRRVEPPVK